MKIWVDSKIVFGLLLYQIFAMSKWLGLLILHQQCVLPRRQLFLKWLVSGYNLRLGMNIGTGTELGVGLCVSFFLGRRQYDFLNLEYLGFML